MADPVLNEAFESYRSQQMEIWANTTPMEVDAREDAWRSVKALDGLASYLRAFIVDGKILKRGQ